MGTDDHEEQAQGLDGPIPEPLARDVYHVVREALVNAVRHGGASAVRLWIAHSEGDAIPSAEGPA